MFSSRNTLGITASEPVRNHSSAPRWPVGRRLAPNRCGTSSSVEPIRSTVDLDARTVSIERNRVQAGGGNVVENDPKTLSSRRTLPLDDGLAGVLRRASARYAQEWLALGVDHRDSGYVAVNEIGEPYTPDTLTRMWLKMAKAAGVRPIRLHDPRHSCGTAMHLRGVPVVTTSLYVHSQDDALNAAAKSLGAFVTSS